MMMKMMLYKFGLSLNFKRFCLFVPHLSFQGCESGTVGITLFFQLNIQGSIHGLVMKLFRRNSLTRSIYYPMKHQIWT